MRYLALLFVMACSQPTSPPVENDPYKGVGDIQIRTTVNIDGYVDEGGMVKVYTWGAVFSEKKTVIARPELRLYSGVDNFHARKSFAVVKGWSGELKDVYYPEGGLKYKTDTLKADKYYHHFCDVQSVWDGQLIYWDFGFGVEKVFKKTSGILEIKGKR